MLQAHQIHVRHKLLTFSPAKPKSRDISNARRDKTRVTQCERKFHEFAILLPQFSLIFGWKMEESEVYEGQVQGWTVVNEEVISSNPQEGPLMVAMQPGAVEDPSAMEVVVISTGNPGDFVVQLPPGSDIAPEQIVAAVEEVQGEDTEEPVEEFPGESKEDFDQDESELSFSSSSESEAEAPPAAKRGRAGGRGKQKRTPAPKKPKAREFSRRLVFSKYVKQ